MAAPSNKGPGNSLAEINVTPLVDVMLVLLIIFMVTAPMIEQGVDINLPNTETVEIESDEGKSILTIQQDGTILLGTTPVAIEELEEKLKFNKKIQDEQELYIHADENLLYKRVVRVMAIARKAGVSKLGMITEPLNAAAAKAEQADKGKGK